VRGITVKGLAGSTAYLYLDAIQIAKGAKPKARVEIEVQTKGGPIRQIRAGDTVWIPPGEKHWHGASPKNAMVHIAMQESLDGSHVTWMEKVSDEEYGLG